MELQHALRDVARQAQVCPQRVRRYVLGNLISGGLFSYGKFDQAPMRLRSRVPLGPEQNLREGFYHSRPHPVLSF